MLLKTQLALVAGSFYHLPHNFPLQKYELRTWSGTYFKHPILPYLSTNRFLSFPQNTLAFATVKTTTGVLTCGFYYHSEEKNKTKGTNK